MASLQREVQRLLGRCLLRLQQYELLIKAIVAYHKISGPVREFESVRAARMEEAARKTLGALVGDLLGSYVVTDDAGTAICSEDEVSFSFRTRLILSEADFARTKDELDELVGLRNGMVHNFIEQHDLWSVDGCRVARDALVAAYSRIDEHFEQLRGWVEAMEHSRRLVAEFVHSEAFHDLVVNGIAPDGTVDWSDAAIVRALREATAELAVDGWTSIAEAGRWIAERFPEQLPAKYGCSSWRQVVHESRAFELRYFNLDGQRAARYREK